MDCHPIQGGVIILKLSNSTNEPPGLFNPYFHFNTVPYMLHPQQQVSCLKNWEFQITTSKLLYVQ